MAFLGGDDNRNNLNGGDGNDTIFGYAGADTIEGHDGDDLIYGNQGVDGLYGHFGNDTIYGGQNYDNAFGGDGDDHLYGNKGDDTLYGGIGNDVFFYAGAGDDYIMDFDTNHDQLVFERHTQADLDQLIASEEVYVAPGGRIEGVRFTDVNGGTIIFDGITPADRVYDNWLLL